MIKYVMARNRNKRPTLQHIVSGIPVLTACGTEMLNWSRVYQNEPIPVLLCRRCKHVHAANR